MISLEKISLKNIIVHKDTSLDINKGITVIRGENGSGKSLLFSSIPTIFDGAPPLLKKKDVKVMHSTTSDSALGIKYKYDNKEYKVIQYKNKANISYKIKEDNKELDPRTISIAKDILSDIWPISSNQYYSLVHITTYRPSILLSGNGSQRKEFFEELFHLNINEKVAEQVKQKLNDLKRQKDEQDILKEQFQNYTYIDNLNELENEFEALNKEYSQLNSQYIEYTNNIQKITAITTYKSQLKTKFNLDELKTKINEYKAKLKNLEDKRVQLKLSISTYENNQNNLKIKQDLIDQLKSLSSEKFNDYSSNDIYELINKYIDKYNKNKEKLVEIDENNKNYNKYKELDESLSNNFKIFNNLEDLMNDFSKREVENNNLNELVLKLKKLDGIVKCPTCGQHIDNKEINSLISNYENIINKNNEYLKYKDNTILYYNLKLKNLEYIDSKDFLKKLNKLKEYIDNLKSEYEKAKKREEIKNKLDAFPEILKLEKPDENVIIKLEDNINKGKSGLDKLIFDLNIQQQLSLLYNEGLDISKKDNLEANIKELSNKIDSINEQRMLLNSKIELGKKQNSDYVKIKNKISDIENNIKDIHIYEALVKAYGAKGIKIAQISYLADSFCTNLNKYASLIYNKPIKFYVNVDSSSFNIYAERNGDKISDVCLLSGAESRCFLLLCAISLLPFIPEKYRTDFIILDEVEAGMKKNTRNFITSGYFKALLNIVPKIIIITPMQADEYYIESDNEYFLKLDNNQTIMEKIR